MVLIERGVDHRHLPLTKGIIQAGIDHGLADPDTRRRVTVHHQRQLPPPLLLVRVDIGQFRAVGQCLENFGRPFTQVSQMLRPQGKLEQGCRAAATNAKVLHGLQIQAGSRFPPQFFPQSRHDLIQRNIPFVRWL